jgi:hypothetical protein
VLCGWPPERIAVWQDLHRLDSDPTPKALIRLLHHHQKALGADWVRRKSLSLVAQDGSSESIHWLRESGGSHPHRFEQTLLAAWTTDPNHDPWLALERWQDCAVFLERRWHETKDPDLALRIEEALPMFGSGGGLGGGPLPFPSLPDPFAGDFGDDDDEGVPDHVIEMLRIVGIKKALEIFGAPPEVIRSVKEMERMFGIEAATDLLIQLLESGDFSPFDGLPFPPEPQPQPRRGRKRSRVDDDDDNPDQLDLF